MMTVGKVPCGFWFELVRNGQHYYKVSKGKKGYHSLCVKEGESRVWNMSNQSHARLIEHKGKPKIRKFYA